jgi:NADPH:quinone reductase-like Zn-dependent oxidoreductase
MVLTLVTRERVTSFVAKRNAEDLADLAERIDAGQIVPVIDRTYPMAEVPDAVRYLEAGHVAGKLVLTV